MSGTNPVFLVRKAKKSSGQKDAVLWCSDDFEAANATLDYLLIKSGAKLKDYFKAVATNFPVVNELPPEGELSLTFCDYYQLAKDNMTWTQIPGVTLPSSEAAAAARQHIVDGVDTETGEVLEDHTENFGNESNSPAQATAPAPELTVVATMPLRHRVLAQYIGEGEYLYHVDASQKKEILRLEMDTDNSYVQNLLLAAENVEAFKKAIEHDIHKIVNAVKKVFPVDGKTPELATVIQFLKTWFETEHIDRGLLVKEWAKGNRVSAIQRTESGANAGGGNKTDRNPDYEHTLDTLDVEIAMATLPMDFNIYELPGSVYRRAKEIVKKKESPFKEWSAALRATPGILDYSRAAIFALIRSAHPEFYHYPGRLQGYINANLTETDHENPTEEALTAARHTPEKDAVEEANRQLAAARGEYVEGISDPNDPKWVHNNYSASNQGEKEEVVPEEKQPAAEPEAVTRNADGTFDVSALFPPPSNQTEKTEARTERDGETPKESNQQGTAGDTGQEITTDGGSGTGGDEAGEAADPVENGNFTVPDDIQPGIYYDIPNEAYHAGPGVSKSQLDDIADTPAIYLWRKNAPVDTEKTKTLDTGTAFHCRILEPEEFSKRFIIAPEFNRRTSAGKEEEKTFLEECARTGRTVLTAEEGRKIELMYQSVMALPLGQWLVESAGYAESSVYWEDPETGILCRCRPDKIIPEFHWIMDVKTTADIQRFRTAYYDYRYHVQDAFYSDGYRAQFGEIPTFVFLVASTTAECGRYPVEIFMMGEDAKLAGQREYRRNLQTLAECLNNDEWPAIKTLSLPRWAKENANA
ncbi:RecE family exodeoxyribonuclease [Salmonella enterica]|uniref:RecE family exodeoxyribonuclease n=1 Tax=Salmonella enterica TaxID=28901 RepID=UPI0009A9CB68|nr:RecE family exodeoxyribonuclease [Salmonella enterica]EDM9619687.1 exonuclease VIII [Salmonella enterica subsp. enterica serovar Montevideo]EHE2169207.1 exonuclease VIII [Salmonella enterica subsp. enterica serovar Montevideo]EHE2253283.1 exonuclease VIII [Salmonella enterica subsp. enterica serovar Montevideo]EIB8004603.1 PD-(D/E)XK nuclease-like domain-containing protein [Salmonella enterica]EIU7363583.1 PD-(D/E)XK nuclease-like domain-containing protein [Salmonella enterica subsp. enteri